VSHPAPDPYDTVATGAASVPPPVLLTVMAWEDGFAPPAVPTNWSDVGDSPIAGGTGAALTVSVTLAVRGVFDAPAEASDKVAV
jgi:hypothetical protein